MTAYFLSIVPSTWVVASFAGNVGEYLTGPEARATYANLFATVYTLMVNSLLLRVFGG
jgi:hypothetical protein